MDPYGASTPAERSIVCRSRTWPVGGYNEAKTARHGESIPQMRAINLIIEEFSYTDLQTGWHLAPVRLDQLNLLVGLSGSGKTSILNALTTARRAALGLATGLESAEWDLTVRFGGRQFRWQATTQALAGDLHEFSPDDDDEPRIRFRSEQIRADGQILAERNADRVIFAGQKLPKLKDTESLISLFEQEEAIAPLHTALRRVASSKADDAARRNYFLTGKPDIQKFGDINELRENDDNELLQRAFILQERFPDEFQRVCHQYTAIFPSVDQVAIRPMAEVERPSAMRKIPALLRDSLLLVAIKERGVSDWIPMPRMSSGMQRTLLHLFELALLPDGTTVLIDEFENSLGVNCLPSVTDHLLARSRELQFILTSHHPYVINNIPIAAWRVVTRKQSEVTVRRASEVPGVDSPTSQQAFIRLLNSPAFEEGIQ